MKHLPLVILVLISVAVSAKKNAPFGPTVQQYENNVFYLELLGGGIMPSMKFEGTNFDNYQSGRFTGQTEGIGFRIQSTKSFSYGALISYRAQGLSVPDQNKYLLNTNYLNLFVPLEFGVHLIQSKRKASPVLLGFAGPYAAYFLNGNAEAGGEEYPITSAEISQWDAGIEVGLGLRIPTFSLQGKSDLNLKVSYYYGLMNTYPNFDAAYPEENLDILLLSKTGSRFNRGIRFTFSYALSFGKGTPQTFTAGGDGKKTYRRFLNVHK